jgi:linoleoyl-CoA desaturase
MAQGQESLSTAGLKFQTDNSFQLALRNRVEAYFRVSGRRQRDCPEMYVKSAILLGAFALSYVLLVFVAEAWWLGVVLAAFLGLVAAAIGFNIEHDGSHQAFSKHAWINKVTAMTLELLGGSSYMWRWKHVLFHHTYVNVHGHDPDINLAPLARLSPHQKRRAHHRWQHLYAWAFYGLLPVKYQLIGDFRNLITGRIGGHPIPRPRGGELAIFVAGKAGFYTLAFGIPLALHSVWTVLACYAIAVFVAGILLSVVFQMAHCVSEAEFPMPATATGRVERAWAVHQVETTVDFARQSRIAAWLLGGLNFQIEHHLFPRISHVNYPAIAGLVEATCREFGIRYAEHPTCWAGLVSHFRWLRKMGMPDAGRSARHGTKVQYRAGHEGARVSMGADTATR